MKRFRYNDPSLRTPFQKFRPILYAFVAWNMIGIFGWKWLSSRARENDPEWTNKSEAERILSVYGSESSTTKKISLFGSAAKEDKETGPSS